MIQVLPLGFDVLALVDLTFILVRLCFRQSSGCFKVSLLFYSKIYLHNMTSSFTCSFTCRTSDHPLSPSSLRVLTILKTCRLGPPQPFQRKKVLSKPFLFNEYSAKNQNDSSKKSMFMIQNTPMLNHD